jgi:8-oxo-dGTP pyrophosphatase MutT (NUDIX family)
MKQGCALLVFGNVDGKVKILTAPRKDGSGAALPGGKPEPGERAIQTALRETLEETGLFFYPSEVRHLYSGVEIPGWVTNCFYVIRTLNPAPPLVKQEGEPLAQWAEWEDLFEGPYGNYNRKLFEVVNT